MTALSVMAIALLSWWLFRQFAIELSLMHGLLFGVLRTRCRSPCHDTQASGGRAERALGSRLAGESLLNSLFCVILFMVLRGELGASNVFDPPGQQVGGGGLWARCWDWRWSSCTISGIVPGSGSRFLWARW